MVAASKGCFHGGVSKRRKRRVLCFLAFSPLGLLACGPSFQAVYEGNVRFEHCYAMEERPQLATKEKADCWHDWSERYTFGQTRDRIHYATARYVALSQSVPTDEAMMMAAPGMTERQSTINAPAPTNAFAPPPKVLDMSDAGAGKPSRPSEVPVISGVGTSSVDAGDAAPSKPAPGAACIDTCGSTFHGCTAKDCDKVYRACVRTCVK